MLIIFFSRVEDSKIRGFRLKARGATLFFTQRIVRICNKLPKEATEVDTIPTFKRHLDRCRIMMGQMQAYGTSMDKVG